MKPDQTSQTPLEERQCRELLGRMTVGRVVYTVGALPAVLPVRYRLDAGGGVLLRADRGSELHRAVAGALVAFEVSELSETDGSGWSVTVLGRADLVADPSPAEAGPRFASPGPAGQVSIRILPELVTGRTLTGRPATGV